MAETKKNNDKKRKLMSIWVFLFFSIAGGGFVLKGVINQFTQFGNYTLIIYAVCILIYAIPYLFMIIEFSSLKKIQGNESGYQSWISLIVGRKYGFVAGFFYFFVNLFFFLDLLPALVNNSVFFIMGDKAENILFHANQRIWFKPIVGVVSIMVFWGGTLISTKGPKWLSYISSGAGLAGMLMTLIFIVAAFIFICMGKAGADGFSMNLWQTQGKDKNISAVVNNDISWTKIASISWALQSMGGLETMAAYKNDFKGGKKTFKRVITWNVAIFSAFFLVLSIMIQFMIPADQAATRGLFSTIYYAFKQVGFGPWMTHLVGFILTIATLSSLLLWTAAPVKMLMSDAPKGIFGSKLSKLSKRDATPVNGLIAQAIIVTILIILQIAGSLYSGMNTFLQALRNLDGGAATIPVLFMTFAYVKMRLMKNNPNFKRDYHFLGKNPVWAILAITPMIIIFLIATVTGLIPAPSTWKGSDIVSPIMQVVLGPVGIALAWIGCEFAFRKWKRKNPNDHSIFNVFIQGETKDSNLVNKTKTIIKKKSKSKSQEKKHQDHDEL